MTIRAVIWDLGGVLLRTSDPAPRSKLAEEFGLSGRELEYLFYGGESGDRCQIGEITFEEHVENVRKKLNVEADEMPAFVDRFWGGDIFDQELVEYIRGLNGTYKTGLLSNAFSNLREWLAEDNKVDGAFDEMVISAEVGMMKPDPRIYHMSLEGLGVAPEEAVFVDDMPRNIEGAQAIGMYGVRFVDPDQTKGELERLLNE